MANWKSVVAWGTFEELTGEDERNEGLQKLLERILPDISSDTVKLSPQWPFPTEDYTKIEGIVFRIRLTEKTGRFEMIDPEIYRK
jgi:nitroimidazol reductase NimA-like FMN-containing flavoprotein (pyridoxamine 5'-phosphate oxidase superfamily)